MAKEELPEAVKYEAKQYVPMPLSEVILDWSVIEGEVGKNRSKGTPLKILLVVVPIEFVNQYQEIAALAGLKLEAVEAEAFALMRALIGKDKRSICVIDIGAQSTTVNIPENGVLKKSHSFDISGYEFTKIISESMSISPKEAEELKIKNGLTGQNSDISKILMPLIDHILNETKNILRSFSQTSGKEVEKIILAGGSARLPGLKEYFAKSLGKETVAAEPFANIFYPPILEEKIRQLSPSYAVAVGTAMRGLEL